MRISLSAKNKINFINGTIKASKTPNEKLLPSDRCNYMVISWILNSVTPDIAGSVIYTEFVADVWNDLCDLFSH